MSQLGDNGYCTKTCVGEGKGNCPGGFTCFLVDELTTEFRDTKLCVRDEDVPAAPGEGS